MATLQHPSDEELSLFLLEDLPQLKSLRVARHLQTCSSCLDRSSQQLARLTATAAPRSSWQSASWLTVAALACVGSAAALLYPPRAPQFDPVTMAAVDEGRSVPVFEPPAPAVAPALVEAEPPRVLPRPVRRPRVETVRYVARRTFVPTMQRAVYEPRYVSLPRRPVTFAETAAIRRIAAMPTDVGPFPEYPARTAKKNFFLRFLGVIAKPFRADPPEKL